LLIPNHQGSLHNLTRATSDKRQAGQVVAFTPAQHAALGAHNSMRGRAARHLPRAGYPRLARDASGGWPSARRVREVLGLRRRPSTRPRHRDRRDRGRHPRAFLTSVRPPDAVPRGTAGCTAGEQRARRSHSADLPNREASRGATRDAFGKRRARVVGCAALASATARSEHSHPVPTHRCHGREGPVREHAIGGRAAPPSSTSSTLRLRACSSSFPVVPSCRFRRR